MWYDSQETIPDWSAAIRKLSKVDPVLKTVIKRVGPCVLAPRRDYFVVLCISIFNQQISTVVAGVLFGRFRDQFPGRKPTPARVLAFLQGDEERIRACGISRQKKAYLIDLAQHFIDGKIPVRKLPGMTDDEVIEALTAVHGIGQWTAEMFLIFVLNRPDIFPVDDLGLQEAVREIYQLPKRPTPKELLPFGELWRPWRTIATWYLWRRNEG